MKMHAYTCSVLALLAACHALAVEATPNEWGPLTNSAQMAISVTSPWSRGFRVDDTNALQAPYSVKGDLKAGERFSLLVRIRNLSTNETLNFYNAIQATTDANAGLACVVTSPSGRDVSPTRTFGGGSGAVLTARPSRTTEFEFVLSELCKLEEIGTYKITARKRTFGNAEKAFVLVSNTLCVPVVPGK